MSLKRGGSAKGQHGARGEAAIPRTGTRSGTRGDAARRAMGDAELRDADTADVNASVPGGSQEDLIRFVHAYYFETCVPSRRSLIVCLPLHLCSLLTVGVSSVGFDSITTQWKYKPTERRSARYWGLKTDAAPPLNTVTRLKQHGLDCNRRGIPRVS